MRRCGHPRKLCSAEERKILRIIKKNLATTASEISSEIKEYSNKEIHSRSIRRVLTYQNRIVRKKSFINKVNRKKRVQFAEEYLNCDIEF